MNMKSEKYENKEQVDYVPDDDAHLEASQSPKYACVAYMYHARYSSIYDAVEYYYLQIYEI